MEQEGGIRSPQPCVTLGLSFWSKCGCQAASIIHEPGVQGRGQAPTVNMCMMLKVMRLDEVTKKGVGYEPGQCWEVC